MNEFFLFKVSGKDATRYINARLTNNINIIEGYQLSFMLTPQGRVEGQFYIYRLENEFLFFSFGKSDEIIPLFKKYLVADRVIVEKLELNLSKITNDKIFNISNNEISIYNNFLGSEITYTFTKENKINLDLDIRFDKNKPIFPLDLNNILLPEIDTDGIAKNKGCYVGQEVIERVYAIGKVPSIIRRVDFNNAVSPGLKFYDQNKKLTGEIINVDATNKKTFSRVKNAQLEKDVFINDIHGEILFLK